MRIETHRMVAARYEICGGDGPLATNDWAAAASARKAGWAEENGATRCPECRADMNARIAARNSVAPTKR